MSIFNPATGTIDSLHNPASGDSPSGPYGRAATDDAQNDAIEATQTFLSQLWGATPRSTPSVTGPPTTGTWAVGQTVLDANGVTWVCVTAGTPGTLSTGSGVELAEAELAADLTGLTATGAADLTGLSITFIAPARPFIIELTVPMIGVSASGNTMTVQVTNSANVVVAQGTTFPTSYGGSFYSPPFAIRARLPRVGGTNAFAVTAGASYTFKARYALGSAGTGTIATNSGAYRPTLRAVTC